MLFIDFSSAFNTIIHQHFIQKLDQLGPHSIRVGSNTSNTIILKTGAPQGCVLSPLLFTLLTHDFIPKENSSLFIKIADNTTVVGLVTSDDETSYREEVDSLVVQCEDNNLALNVDKTKELLVDFRRVPPEHLPLTNNGVEVERVVSTSHGRPTLQPSPRRHNNGSTSSVG